ncbi:proline dehydrogenase family protein [Neobacillus niacini]|uniref:proline dehydrogenase family protein n=1 Tax=Neobacillus niacini TaxID=86668 RepID=UPI003982DE0E
MEVLLGNFFHALARNRVANRAAKKFGFKMGARRFVAGISIENAINAVKSLNSQGKMATMDHLGEFVASKEEAAAATTMCVETLKAIAISGVDSNLSLKLTSLGLDVSKEICISNLEIILAYASQQNIFVRIDMEDYAHYQITLDIYKQLKEKYDNFGLVMQAYLFRAEEDSVDLNNYNTNLRIVKGAYKESSTVAFESKQDVDDNYIKLIKLHLLNGNYTAVASHDEKIINQVKEFIRQENISNNQVEFQMLYGISESLQNQLVSEGYRVRVYVPYGVDWFGYFMRRLAERPANVQFVIKNFFK